VILFSFEIYHLSVRVRKDYIVCVCVFVCVCVCAIVFMFVCVCVCRASHIFM